jgi:micrococcal nuclease
MKKIGFIFLFLAIYLLCSSQTYHGTILRVIDGDSFIFQTEEGSLRVRLQGIDAPEKDQPFGIESTKFMEGYLNKPADLIYYGLDQYDRTLGTLMVEGQNINLISLKLGFSWHFKKYSKDVDFANAEIYARNNRLGLWKLDNPIPPWEWRKSHKK